MNKKILLALGLGLLVVGLVKPNLSNPLSKPESVVDTIVVVTPPSDEKIKQAAESVVSILKESGVSIANCRRLSSLYCDMARLVELDGEDMVIKNTEEIKQANSLSGLMLRLDIKGKYPKLAEAAKAVVVAGVGDDSVSLDSALRAKAVESFMALSWAFNEASK